MGRLYHYTNQESLAKIKRSKYIRQSKNFERDCVYGDGVYLTSLNPKDWDKADLAKNNYGGGWKKRLEDGRLDCYVEIEIPFSNLSLERCEAGDRDVYLYQGNLDLSQFTWEAGQNSEWSFAEVLGVVALGAVGLGGLALLGKLAYDAFTSSNEPKKEEKKKTNR